MKKIKHKIITPKKAIKKRINLTDNYLIKKCVDYLNAKIACHDIYYFNDPELEVPYYAIITTGHDFDITSVLDHVVSLFIAAGWDAYHDKYYSNGMHHAVFFRTNEFTPNRNHKYSNT